MFGEAVPPSLQAIDRARHLTARIAAADASVLDAALAPDMFTCAEQLRTVGIFALRCTYTLIGQDWPKDMLGPEFPQGADGLDARLAKAHDQIRALTPADFDGAEARRISHVAGDAQLTQSGANYLRLFALPNLWFHLSMAFAVARAQGLAVGKADYDGWHQYAPGFSFVRR
ncbi:MAG: DUF1993 family protein [Rhodobacteraceae bacterium]|nr:MAG: DUF1993 family protein [Paracoccaceae bacterium]